MPKFVVRTDGDPWRALRSALEQMAVVTREPEVNLTELGKALAAVVASVRSVFVAAGLPSVRMDAAVKALDLTTPKSALERFVRPT